MGRGRGAIDSHIIAINTCCSSSPVINPRRACAARVTVVVLSARLSVCLSVHILFSYYRLRDGLLAIPTASVLQEIEK